jgi:monoamine oxidase
VSPNALYPDNMSQNNDNPAAIGTAVIVIGAGAAGLSAAAELAESGRSVIVVDARERIGGRMYTLHDLGEQFPIELGAEFIHGLTPEILDPLRQNNIPITEVDGDNWCFQNGCLTSCDFFSDVDDILQRMNDDGPDESFASFLERCCRDVSDDARKHALSYVAGFNAADPSKVGVHWLFHQMKAEEKIEGERAFHARGGYESFLSLLRERVVKSGASVRTNTVVNRVVWAPGKVSVEAVCAKQSISLQAHRLLVTVPLGVLQAQPGSPGAIEFNPPLPQEKLESIAGMEMGKVLRVVLHFRERFWNQIHPSGRQDRTMANMSFLFSQDEWFPTWWTAMPDRLPIITAWAPWRCAEKLESDNVPIVTRALQTLGRLLGMNPTELESMLEIAYFHDWQADPFSRGAYSYVKAGAADAPEILSRAVKDTLFFAGEAADVTGNNGTVHGAIASARRAVAIITKTDKAAAAD